MGLLGTSDPVKQEEKALQKGESDSGTACHLRGRLTSPQRSKHDDKALKEAEKDLHKAEKHVDKVEKEEHHATRTTRRRSRSSTRPPSS